MTAIDQNTADFTRIAALDHVPGFTAAEPRAEVLHREGDLSSMLLRLLGGCMLLASTGIWLAPGAVEDPEFALVRVGVSVFMLFAGLVLLLSNRQKKPEFYNR